MEDPLDLGENMNDTNTFDNDGGMGNALTKFFSNFNKDKNKNKNQMNIDDTVFRPTFSILDLDIDDESDWIAKNSVQWYCDIFVEKVMKYAGDYINEDRGIMQIISEALYNDAMHCLWCLKQFPGLYYFCLVGTWLISAPGQQTQSEKAFKWINYWCTPARNQLAPRTVKNIHKIHSKIMEDNLNLKQKEYCTSGEINCLLILKITGLSDHSNCQTTYNALLEKIKSKGHANQDKNKIKGIMFF